MKLPPLQKFNIKVQFLDEKKVKIPLKYKKLYSVNYDVFGRRFIRPDAKEDVFVWYWNEQFWIKSEIEWVENEN